MKTDPEVNLKTSFLTNDTYAKIVTFKGEQYKNIANNLCSISS